MDKKVRVAIKLFLFDLALMNVQDANPAKVSWGKLQCLYEAKSLVNEIFLRRKLYNFMMKEGDKMAEHLNTFNSLVNQLESRKRSE